MMEQKDVVVIGGGQAGLAAGYHLRRKELEFTILESQAEAVGSWPNYYDSLKLFSPARFSSLPGMKFPGDPNGYPLRDEVIAYLRQYQDYFQLPIRVNEPVRWVERDNAGFILHTESGERLKARAVINASGSFSRPFIPRIKGMESFGGRILHSSGYRNPMPFVGQRVIVAGRGNSAVQIAVELAEHSTVSLAVLRPVKFSPQRTGGQDIHFWMRVTGLDTFPFWRFGLPSPNPSSVMDLDRYKERLAAGNPAQKQMFTSFISDGVVWPDGQEERIDAVIFATGYRPNLLHLRGLEAVDAQGTPLQTGGVSTTVPGLYYVGIYGQRSFASATIRGVGSDARYVVGKLGKYLKQQGY